MENLSANDRKLVLPMMKNYIEKYTPAGDFEKSKVRVLVRGDLQDFVGETQGPVTRVESLSPFSTTSKSSRSISPPRFSTHL